MGGACAVRFDAHTHSDSLSPVKAGRIIFARITYHLMLDPAVVYGPQKIDRAECHIQQENLFLSIVDFFFVFLIRY